MSRRKFCKQCGREAFYPPETCCRACNSPASLTASNVQIAADDENRRALADRYARAYSDASAQGTGGLLELLDRAVDRTAAVVNVDPIFAYEFLTKDDVLYAPYHRLVDAGVRAPAVEAHDRHRTATDHVLYGTHGRAISFAALSLTGRGLKSYGSVHFELETRTVGFRSTILEENSYGFVSRHAMVPGTPRPNGYLSTWADRRKLAVSKLAHRLRPDMTSRDVEALILEDSGERASDSFLEVHVFGTFNHQAVQSVVLPRLPVRRPETVEAKVERVLVEALKERLNANAVAWTQ